MVDKIIHWRIIYDLILSHSAAEDLVAVSIDVSSPSKVSLKIKVDLDKIANLYFYFNESEAPKFIEKLKAKIPDILEICSIDDK